MSEAFLKIINMSISASWLVLAVLLLRLVLKKAPKWVSVLLWGFVAVRLICPISIESVLSLIPSAETISPEIMMDRTPEISTGVGSLDTVVNPIITHSFAPKPYASANPLQILIPVAAIAWIAGIGVMLLYIAVSYLLLRRKVATAVLLRNNIYQSENVGSAFVLGIIKPKIYLPFQTDGKNLEHVIAHEASHIRRKDHWWKPLGFLLLAIHWFNPLMWLGYILLCRDIELACDEKVIKKMDSETKADYTQALVACSINRRSIAACPLAFGEVGVKERVKSVMNYKKPTLWIIIAAIAICAAVAVCFLTNPSTGINEKLSIFIDCQIAERFQTERSQGNACCVNWKVLGTEKRGAVTSVYMWVLYDEYSKIDRGIKQVTSIHTPTLITVKREAGEYKLIEYWEPKAGGLREPSIREKFPEYLQDEALDRQRYFQTQLDENEKMALDYFHISFDGDTEGTLLGDLLLIKGAAGEIVDSNGNIIKQALQGALIIINNDTGEVVASSKNDESLAPTYLYVVDNATGKEFKLEDNPMTAAQLISFFVNGGKEMLDGPVNQDVHIAKRDVQQKATIHSIVVNTASVTFRYTYGADAVQEPGEFGDVKVVLADGTVVEALGPYGVPGDNGEFISTYAMSTIIPVEDIDYVQVGETIVAVAQITHQGNLMIPLPEETA